MAEASPQRRPSQRLNPHPLHPPKALWALCSGSASMGPAWPLLWATEDPVSTYREMIEVLQTSDCAQVGLADNSHPKMTGRMESDKTSTACGAVDDWWTWILRWSPWDGGRCHLSLMECHVSHVCSPKGKCSFGCCYCSQFSPYFTAIKKKRSAERMIPPRGGMGRQPSDLVALSTKR